MLPPSNGAFISYATTNKMKDITSRIWRKIITVFMLVMQITTLRFNLPAELKNDDK